MKYSTNCAENEKRNLNFSDFQYIHIFQAAINDIIGYLLRWLFLRESSPILKHVWYTIRILSYFGTPTKCSEYLHLCALSVYIYTLGALSSDNDF
mgnify:CR=1 FL=1